MKSMVWTFVMGVTLLIGSYAVMIGAVSVPGVRVGTSHISRTGPELALSTPEPAANATAPDNGEYVTISRAAAQNVMDCYAGKPVFLVPGTSRPLYPSCAKLLQIYMDHTDDPAQVLRLLSDAQANSS